MSLKSLLSKLAKIVPPVPDVAHVAEKTSARQVNRMLAHGWTLLAVVAVAVGYGTYPCATCWASHAPERSPGQTLGFPSHGTLPKLER